MRVSTLQILNSSMNGITNQQEKISKTQKQLMTGERFDSPSEDPIAAAQALELDKSINLIDQYNDNISNLETRMAYEETAIDQAEGLLLQIRNLVLQANSGILNESDKKTLAREIRQYNNGIIDIANGKDSNGEYLFSGFKTQNQPFEFDGINYNYNGDRGTRELQVGAATKIKGSDSGFELFITKDTSGNFDNVFNMIENFAQSLENDTYTQSDVDNTLTDLGNIHENFLATRSSIGGRLNSLEAQKSVNSSLQVKLQETFAETKELDYAEAISRLSGEMVALEAAQQVFVKIQGLSLFNKM